MLDSRDTVHSVSVEYCYKRRFYDRVCFAYNVLHNTALHDSFFFFFCFYWEIPGSRSGLYID